MGTTPSGIMQGRLTYGYFSTIGIGQAQAAFVDLRLQNGDMSYGLAGALPSFGASVQPVRYSLYVATPTLQAQWGSESWGGHCHAGNHKRRAGQDRSRADMAVSATRRAA